VGAADITKHNLITGKESRFFRATDYDELDSVVPRLAYAIKKGNINN